MDQKFSISCFFELRFSFTKPSHKKVFFYCAPQGRLLFGDPRFEKGLVSVRPCVSGQNAIFANDISTGQTAQVNCVISTFDFRFSKNIMKNLKKPLEGMIENFHFLDTFLRTFLDFFIYEASAQGKIDNRDQCLHTEGKSQEMSGHVFELHTPVLELGVRGATHALRVLSSRRMYPDYRPYYLPIRSESKN